MATSLTKDLSHKHFFHFFIPAMLIGDIAFYHFIILSVTLILAEGQNVRRKNPVCCIFLYTFQVVKMKFDVMVMKHLKF